MVNASYRITVKMKRVYRTSDEREIFVLRRSPRRRPKVIAVVLGALAILTATVAGASGEPVRVVLWASALGVLCSIVWMLLATRPLLVARAGPELRVRHGVARASFLVGEVRGVEVDTLSVHAHAVVLVLADGRRARVGEPHDRMTEALAACRALREGLR